MAHLNAALVRQTQSPSQGIEDATQQSTHSKPKHKVPSTATTPDVRDVGRASCLCRANTPTGPGQLVAPLQPTECRQRIAQLAAAKPSAEEARTPLAPARATKMTLLEDGPAFAAALLEDIKGAQHSVHIHEYGLERSPMASSTVNRLLDACMERAREGIQVRWVVDAFGSEPERFQETFDAARKAGVEIVVNDTFAVCDKDGTWGQRRATGQFDEIFHPDHRKYMIVDGKAGYLGGMGWEEHFYRAMPGKYRMHDIMVRFEGPMVAQLQALFFTAFRFLGGEIPSEKATLRQLVPHVNTREAPMQGRLLSAVPEADFVPHRDTYKKALEAATSNITLVTPYLGEPGVTRRLCEAAQRGVRVRCLFPKEPEHWLAEMDQYKAYDVLLDAGVEIYEYEGLKWGADDDAAPDAASELKWSQQLHAKMLFVDVADDKTLLADTGKLIVGSINTDNFSMHSNWELGLELEHGGSPTFVRDAVGMIDRDIDERAQQVTERHRSLNEKFGGVVTSVVGAAVRLGSRRL